MMYRQPSRDTGIHQYLWCIDTPWENQVESEHVQHTPISHSLKISIITRALGLQSQWSERLHRLACKECWNLRGWSEHSYHLPSVCSEAWGRKGCQEHAMSGPQEWIYLKQNRASDHPFSPTKGFIFSYTRKVMGNMTSGYSMSSAAFLAKHACLQNVSMSQKGMK